MIERLSRIIRARDVDQYCGLKRTQRAELEGRDEFPKSIPLSDGGRARGYLESELLEWQARRIAKRDANVTAAPKIERVAPPERRSALGMSQQKGTRR